MYQRCSRRKIPACGVHTTSCRTVCRLTQRLARDLRGRCGNALVFWFVDLPMGESKESRKGSTFSSQTEGSSDLTVNQSHQITQHTK